MIKHYAFVEARRLKETVDKLGNYTDNFTVNEDKKLTNKIKKFYNLFNLNILYLWALKDSPPKADQPLAENLRPLRLRRSALYILE